MLADNLSRLQLDRGDYTLSLPVFWEVEKFFRRFGMQPKVDMFASPGNAKYNKFVARWPHHQAIACNALETDLTPKIFRRVYGNPPWSIILPWLERLRKILKSPFWQSSHIGLGLCGGPC
jgi:hypothetical protein